MAETKTIAENEIDIVIIRPGGSGGSGGGSGGGGSGSWGSGTTDYEELEHKPSIEGVTLVGNKTFEDLQLEPIGNMEIENMLS